MAYSAKLELRRDILRSLCADPPVIEELLNYSADCFDHGNLPSRFPLQDDECVAFWERYAATVRASGDIRVLAKSLPQMRFAIRAGMKRDPAYIAATRRGEQSSGETPLEFERPDLCSIGTHPTTAGRAPFIRVNRRSDFETLVRAFSMGSEPGRVPRSMGACTIGGYNNWERVRLLREQWCAVHRGQSFSFAAIASEKSHYQDCFLILSEGPYSDVPHSALGLSEEEWLEGSFVLRLEHECAHYWTRRVLLSMRNNIMDELIADYCGMLAAAGRYRADWQGLFLGIEDSGRIRESGRFGNYQGNPPLSPKASEILSELTRCAIANIAAFDASHREALPYPEGIPIVLLTLTRFTLEELASPTIQSALDMEFSNAVCWANDANRALANTTAAKMS